MSVSDHPHDDGPETWSALQHGRFRRYWIFAFLAFIGAALQSVGAAWLMVGLGGSPLQISLVHGTMSLSVVLAALPAGVIADLYDRRSIILYSLSGMMLATSTIGVLGLLDALTAHVLLLLTFLFGVGAALMSPAMQATLPDLVNRSVLPSAITLNGMSSSAARSVGPAFAGAMIGLIGAGVTLIANAAAFVGLWLVVAGWRPLQRERRVTGPLDGVLAALRHGLAFAFSDLPFRALLVRSLICFLGTSALLSLLPAIVAERFASSGAQGLGLLLSCYGAGSVISSLSIARLSRRTSRQRLVMLATFASGLAMLGAALIDSLLPLGLAMVVAGASWTVALTAINIDAQLMLPRELLARGISISMMALMVSLATGSVIWGAVAARYSLTLAMLLAALTCLLAAGGYLWRMRATKARG